MTSIKLKFRPHRDGGREGALYFQIIHDRTVKQVRTDFHIFAEEWDRNKGCIARHPTVSDARHEELEMMRNRIAWERHRLEEVVKALEESGDGYCADEIIGRYKKSASDRYSVFEYIRRQSERMRRLGHVRTGETYLQTLRSFMRFRGGIDMSFEMMDADTVEHYESYMRANRLSRNTTSFYLRILRCICNRAAAEGLTTQPDPFRRVYTGVDKTAKRAIALKEIRRIKELDLTCSPDLDFARDMFMFSFYLRGMSFVDMAYLRKKDLANGYITYIRKKTGQQLSIRWEKPMQAMMEKYPENPTQYLLPILTERHGSERSQYLNKLVSVNRKLKQVAQMAQIPMPLTTYVARHSWASIAQSKNIPLGIISEGMGHDSEETTRIYLAAIQTSRIDDANMRILKDL